jgi:hypothetical protein
VKTGVELDDAPTGQIKSVSAILGMIFPDQNLDPQKYDDSEPTIQINIKEFLTHLVNAFEMPTKRVNVRKFILEQIEKEMLLASSQEIIQSESEIYGEDFPNILNLQIAETLKKIILRAINHNQLEIAKLISPGFLNEIELGDYQFMPSFVIDVNGKITSALDKNIIHA